MGTVSALLAVRLTIDAIHASGGERVFYVVVAVLAYLFAALLIVGAILRPRLLPGPTDASSSPGSSSSATDPESSKMPPPS